MTEVAEGIHRLTNGVAPFYLLEEQNGDDSVQHSRALPASALGT
jgi:hypothetical protein